MENEILDYVNEHDEVIGQAPRHVIHQQGLKHRASHLFIYNQDKVLLQLRHARKVQFPNCWDTSVGGHVNSKETYYECIVRETKEELGIVCNETLEHIATLPACYNNGWEFTHLYSMHYFGDMVINQEEISAVQWFSRTAINSLLTLNSELFAGNFATLFEQLK